MPHCDKEEIQEPSNPLIHVFRNTGWKPDNHLNYTLWYRKASGGLGWRDGSVSFSLFETAEGQIEHVMQWQTEFVKENWVLLEVMVPNRDQYGWIRPGFIQDTGVLRAVREMKE